MDALIAPPVVAKKKRRSSGTSLSKDNTNNSETTSTPSPKASPPKAFSFYKDMIDEKVDQQTNDSDNVFSDENEDNSNDMAIDNNTANDSEEQNEESNHSELNEEEINHMNVDITVPEIKTTSPSIKHSLTSPSISSQDKNSLNKVKGILTYIKKGPKKSVRFVVKK